MRMSNVRIRLSGNALRPVSFRHHLKPLTPQRVTQILSLSKDDRAMSILTSILGGDVPRARYPGDLGQPLAQERCIYVTVSNESSISIRSHWYCPTRGSHSLIVLSAARLEQVFSGVATWSDILVSFDLDARPIPIFYRYWTYLKLPRVSIDT